mgnify:FL=1
MLRIVRVFVYLILALLLSIYALEFYVDRQLSSKDFSSAYNDCRKVWTARGLYGEGIDQNSIQSIGRAFQQGAQGVEVDVRYDVAQKDYIVSHDYPYRTKNGKILPLSELFNAVGDGHYFWLDFKALRHLSDEQAMEAVQRLKDISSRNGLSDRIYVEGENPTNLAHFRKAGFHTIFDTHPEPESVFVSGLMIAVYKIFYYFGDHTVMGMEYGELNDPVYGDKTRRQLGNIPVFLYHLPADETLVDSLLPVPQVRAFIVGNNLSIDLHHKDNCGSDRSRVNTAR